ncbi:BZ3500_MvSof-1268-A1-R1_Chr1-3g02109 [Microbotryum saponariae]|uniref:Cytochrome c oxidase assembly protein COX20, mitochondrial n=1 Tax=Microbotryum saponariae TaxID=289078 RepID=A0A2X0MGL1_9BASI|nr:BZ3500_MvSof-1268-A1-R1_Chr1-3g02109 [Microbotryum saponariae]SCZ95411.1 BZ3501_MvSof-1269-A2-R1_Chr1-3g01711 [Microbotryum saponariae]
MSTSTTPAQPSTSTSTPPDHSAMAPPSTPSKPGILDALHTISPLDDIKKLPSIPCARYSLLFGIVAGVSVGALRFLFGTRRGGWATQAPRWSQVGVAANWAVGAWGVGSLGAWETCRARQSSEAARMAALVAEAKARRSSRTGPKSSFDPPEGAAVDAQPRIGGFLVGERGREIVLEQQRRAATRTTAATATDVDPSNAGATTRRLV